MVTLTPRRDADHIFKAPKNCLSNMYTAMDWSFSWSFKVNKTFKIPLKVWSSGVRVFLMEYGFYKRVKRRRSQFGAGNIQPQLPSYSAAYLHFPCSCPENSPTNVPARITATIAWMIFWSKAFNWFSPTKPHFIDRSLIPVSQSTSDLPKHHTAPNEKALERALTWNLNLCMPDNYKTKELIQSVFQT